MDTENFTVTEAAEVAGLPRGTLASHRSRQQAPAGRPMGLADVMAVTLIRDLTTMGVRLEVASGIAHGLAEAWPHVLVSERRTLLRIWRGVDGLAVFDTLVEGQEAPEPAAASVLTIDLTAIVRRVLTRVLTLREAREAAPHG